MSLPILQSHHAPGRDDLIRYFHRTELQWCRQVCEDETQLDVGVALSNARLDQVWHANQLLDVALPPGLSPADAYAQVQAHYAAQNAQCWKWVFNPSAPPAQTQPMVDFLLEKSFEKAADDIMYLAGQPPQPVREVPGLTIIPSRASFRHARQLAEEGATEWKMPQLVEASMLHLEDPQSDSWMALKDGAAVAIVTVQAVGEIGCVAELFVSASFRGQGIGRTMMSRALEVCARALFKHVFVAVNPANTAAVQLYQSVGFQRIGEFVMYRASSSTQTFA
jgi:ribosomal protein S18 acetylase RimI-like enzyme